MIFTCVLLAVAVIGFTLIVRDQDIPPAPVEDPELRHLEARRQVLYENLKDLQFEYHQGKLSDQDYASLKQNFLYELAVVMDSIERQENRKGKSAEAPGARTDSSRGRSATGRPLAVQALEQNPPSGQIEAARSAPRETGAAGWESAGVRLAATAESTVVCPYCETPNSAASRFCGECGRKLHE